MPVLYFNYHIGGTRVNIYRAQGAVSTFVLNMCAVVGGIYALAHFIYNTLFFLLGKQVGYQELARWYLCALVFEYLMTITFEFSYLQYIDPLSAHHL